MENTQVITVANVGRPTDYTPELVAKAKMYITDYHSQGDVIPSEVGLCKYIEQSITCVQRWGGEEGKEEFKGILKDINTEQHNVLINKGLTGDFNSAIAKLVLGKHGYHEKQQTEISGPGGKPIETTSKVLNVVGIKTD